MNDEGKNDEKIQTAQTLEKEPKFRLDAIRWSPKDGHYQRVVGLRYSDDVDELVEFCRHPKKNGGFDRAVVYLSAKMARRKSSRRPFGHGPIILPRQESSSIDPTADGGAESEEKTKKREGGLTFRKLEPFCHERARSVA
jgi:hypothetical protein